MRETEAQRYAAVAQAAAERVRQERDARERQLVRDAAARARQTATDPVFVAVHDWLDLAREAAGSVPDLATFVQQRMAALSQAPAQDDGELSEEERRRLLGMTATGRAALKLRDQREAAFSRAGITEEDRALLSHTETGKAVLRRIAQNGGQR